MTRHLTLTGYYAGTYLCGRYQSRIGGPTTGCREPGDTGAHYAYAPAALLTDPATCSDCRHVADCGDDTCARCAELGAAQETAAAR